MELCIAFQKSIFKICWSLMESKDHRTCNNGSLMSGKTISESVLVNQSSALAAHRQLFDSVVVVR